jgi:hypothetical protein
LTRSQYGLGGRLEEDAAELKRAGPTRRGCRRKAARAVQQLLHSSNELSHSTGIGMAILIDISQRFTNGDHLAWKRRGNLVFVYHWPDMIR